MKFSVPVCTVLMLVSPILCHYTDDPWNECGHDRFTHPSTDRFQAFLDDEEPFQDVFQRDYRSMDHWPRHQTCGHGCHHKCSMNCLFKDSKLLKIHRKMMCKYPKYACAMRMMNGMYRDYEDRWMMFWQSKGYGMPPPAGQQGPLFTGMPAPADPTATMSLMMAAR